MTKRESKPVVYEGIEYASLRELADQRFDKNYNAAYQTVYRYEKRRNRPVVWKGREYASLAEMARLAFDPPISRERARQLVNKRDNEQAQG